ncbi:MAG: NADH-quinone oxidoreductase subunit C, partial [Burkholderiaceae bacterium]
MADSLATLSSALESALLTRVRSLVTVQGELTLVVTAEHYVDALRLLRDTPSLGFELAVDLCGVDYRTYGDGAWEGPRYAVVLHLLSLSNNWRLRVRAFAPDDDFPVLPSAIDVWPGLNWFEREA